MVFTYKQDELVGWVSHVAYLYSLETETIKYKKATTKLIDWSHPRINLIWSSGWDFD